MRLQGYPPAGVPAVSYLNSPSGSIIGSAQRPVGRIISLPGLPGNPGVPGEVTNAQLTVALSTKADTSYVDSLSASLSALGPMITNKQPKTLTGTCSTAAGTTAKTVTLDSPWATYTPVAGDRLQLAFTSGNTASAPTLSVNGAAAKPITNSYNILNSAQLRVGAGFPLYMDFDGTRWIANPTYNDYPGTLTNAQIVDSSGNTNGLVNGTVLEYLLVNEATKSRTYTNKTISGSNNTITGPITDTNDPANANTLVRKAYVDAQISALVASSPSTLDTLQELATALGNDPNFATTVTNLIASKQAKFMTGTVATAASTAAKTVTLDSPWSSYTPVAGDWFFITFTSGNTASTPTLAINGTTARGIATAYGQTNNSNTAASAGYGQLFYFDGTRFILTGASRNTTYYAISGYTTISGTSQTGANGNSYLTNNASRVTVTLPTAAAVGDCIMVQGLGAGGWKVQAPASNNIIYEGTSSATAGYIASTNRYDAVLLFCVVANTTWLVVNYSGVISVDGTAVYPTGLATNTYVDAKVAGVVDSAPATLDTLNELAAALGDDPNFATTVSTNLGNKANKDITVTAGTGLTGGGDLSANRTLAVSFGTAAGTACQGNDSRLSDTRTPTDNTVATAKVQDGAITSAKIADGTIVDADINGSAAIAVSKLGTGKVTGSVNGTATTLTLWTGTQAQYDAIGTKDSNTVYVIT